MKGKQPGFFKRLVGSFSASSYPFPPGSQNNDDFERNTSNTLSSVSSEQRALSISTFWACVKLLSGTVASLPINIFERPKGSGKPEVAYDYPLHGILHDQANADMTSFSLIQATVASMAMHGVAYGEKKFSGSRLVAIDFMPFNRVTWQCGNDGYREYFYADATGARRKIPREKLWRPLGFSLDGLNGMSIVQYGARNIGSALSAEVAADQTFTNGLMPTVAFTMEQVLKKDQRDSFRDNFKKEMAGALNAGKPPLLEGGMKAQEIGIDPSDAQLLESRAWSVEEICRWFGILPSMIGHSQKSTTWGTGLEQQNLAFLQYCLQTILTGIEASIRMDLIPPTDRAKYYAKFSIEALLRADSQGRAALYSSGSQNGWMMRSEIREFEDLPFIEGSDVLTVQSNLVPLDQLGTNTDAKNAQDALKTFLGIGEKETT